MSHQQITQEGADKKTTRNQRQTLGYSQKLQSKKHKLSIFQFFSYKVVTLLLFVNLERHFRELEKFTYEEH